MRTRTKVIGVGLVVATAVALWGCPGGEDLGSDVRLSCPLSVAVGDKAQIASSGTEPGGATIECSGAPDFTLTPLGGAPVSKQADGKATVTPGDRTLQGASPVYEATADLIATSTGSITCSAYRDGETRRCTVAVTAAADAAPTDGGDGGPCAPITNFAGAWHATYTCTYDNDAGPPWSDEFDLTITQTGDQASYSTSSVTFTGTVCKNVWTLSGTWPVDAGTGVDAGFEVEQGTLTMNPDGTATKETTWANPTSRGRCTDTFTRR